MPSFIFFYHRYFDDINLATYSSDKQYTALNIKYSIYNIHITWSHRVRIAMAMKGISYEYVPVDILAVRAFKLQRPHTMLICIHLYKCMHIRMRECVYAGVYACMYRACLHVCMQACMYASMYLPIYLLPGYQSNCPSVSCFCFLPVNDS